MTNEKKREILWHGEILNNFKQFKFLGIHSQIWYDMISFSESTRSKQTNKQHQTQ